MAKNRVVLTGACGYAARRARVNHVPLFSGRLVSGRLVPVRLVRAKPSRISAGALRSELRQQMHRDLAGFRQRQGVTKL